MKLYTIRDVLCGFGKTGPGNPVIFNLDNDQLVIRVVKGSVARGQSPNALNTNPEDKEVWCVGEFDTETGKITACEPRLVCRVIDYVEGDKDGINQPGENAEAD